MDADETPRITLESRALNVECLLCSPAAAADCSDLARAFTTHLEHGGTVAGGDALLHRVNRVDEWNVCDECQSRLSVEDKVRLMSFWLVIESMRNWIRAEAHRGFKGILPPPVQLA